MQFDGKNCVITGGLGGIGLAIARCFLTNGAEKIALLDLDYCYELMTVLRKMFPTKMIIFKSTNVCDKKDMERTFNDVMYIFQKIDCVVACAGVLNEEDYQLTVEVNLIGVIHTNYIAMKYMTKETGGHNGGLIVNISSVAGIDCSQFSTPVYNATKHGVVAFTRSMGDNFFYEKTGIKFVVVCPGATQTEFLDHLDRRMISIEAYESASKKLNHVLKQSVDEFAAAFIDVLKQNKNGSVFIIDGGKFKEITYPNPWYDNTVQSQP